MVETVKAISCLAKIINICGCLRERYLIISEKLESSHGTLIWRVV